LELLFGEKKNSEKNFGKFRKKLKKNRKKFGKNSGKIREKFGKNFGQLNKLLSSRWGVEEQKINSFSLKSPFNDTRLLHIP
jgi:hypothetical protein